MDTTTHYCRLSTKQLKKASLAQVHATSLFLLQQPRFWSENWRLDTPLDFLGQTNDFAKSNISMNSLKLPPYVVKQQWVSNDFQKRLKISCDCKKFSQFNSFDPNEPNCLNDDKHRNMFHAMKGLS